MSVGHRLLSISSRIFHERRLFSRHSFHFLAWMFKAVTSPYLNDRKGKPTDTDALDELPSKFLTELFQSQRKDTVIHELSHSYGWLYIYKINQRTEETIETHCATCVIDHQRNKYGQELICSNLLSSDLVMSRWNTRMPKTALKLRISSHLMRGWNEWWIVWSCQCDTCFSSRVNAHILIEHQQSVDLCLENVFGNRCFSDRHL